MPLASWWSLSPKWMPEPKAELSFILALLTRCRDGFPKLWRFLLMLPDGLPTEIRRLRGLLKCVTVLQSPNNPLVFPMRPSARGP